MKSRHLHIALLIVLLFPGILAAQSNTESVIEAVLESQIENLDEGADVALIVEDLQELLENPINLNATSVTELQKLYLLNSIQIENLLQYVNDYGPALSLFELATVDGFTPDLLKKMEAFVFFGPMETEIKNLSDEFTKTRQQILLRSLGTLQKARGYQSEDGDPPPYEGNRFRYYTRYRLEAGDRISAGFTAEKDPGETFFKGSNKQGFDFYSGHVTARINQTIEQITVGDFIVSSGQGLALWQGYTMGKSSDVLDILKYGQGVRPYSSVDENFHFRGAAGSFRFGKTSLTIFASHKNADANLATDDESNNIFTSLQTSGYHRTASEIADEKTVGFFNTGSVLNLHFKHLKLGGTIVYQHFDRSFQPADQLYNRFRFSGNENYTSSIDYFFSKGKYRLFGEAALSKSGGKAFLQGALAQVNDRVGVAALFRHYEKDFQSIWGQDFGESSTSINETGLYLGVKFLPARFVTLSAYSDFYRSPWFNYSTAGPARGNDLLAQADCRFSERLKFYLRVKNETKDQSIKAENTYRNLAEQTRRIRLHFEYWPTPSIRSSSRIESSYFSGEENENGLLAYQDVLLAPESSAIRISGRVAWFKTPGYSSRIYAYENDLLYTFSVPAFFGTGFRSYVNLRWRLSNKMDFWLKLANTHWSDRETISSGYNEIDGRNKTEVKIQFRLKI